jgi:predicted nucleic acid-binding protein
VKSAPPPRALLDTSVFIATETGRPLAFALLPEQGFISVVTLAELQVGVLAAVDVETRSRRLATLKSVAGFTALPIDTSAATAWASMRVRLAETGRRVTVNDLWIAAVAVARDLPVVTQDLDFEELRSIGGPEIIVV